MIHFVTPSLIDMRAFTHFGVNAKQNANPIGYFGTGLKYALAVLCREGAKSITIRRGPDTYAVRSMSGRMRDKEFEFIHLVHLETGNVIELPFTTELGKNWALWMAFRELYSNTLDEQGQVESGKGVPPRLDYSTIISVDSEAFDEIWNNRSEYFLTTHAAPLLRIRDIEIYPKLTRDNAVFMRGIRVAQLDRDMLFTYNLTKSFPLTEDRFLRDMSDFYMTLVGQLRETGPDASRVLDDIFLAERSSWEGRLDHRWGVNYEKPSAWFLEYARKLVQQHPVNLNDTLAQFLAVHTGTRPPPQEVPIQPLDQARLQKAVDFCRRLGYAVSDYQIKVFAPKNDNLLGAAIDNTIWISDAAFNRGTKILAGTILEEYFHLRLALKDESRGLQNYLIDSLVSMGERVLGEPL